MTPSLHSHWTKGPGIARVLACEECDLVHADTPLQAGTSAYCRRCGAMLARNSGGHLERPLALALGALVLFVVANVNQLLQLEVSGQTTSSTLIGAAVRLEGQGMWEVAALVLATTFVGPLLQLGAMCYVLIPLRDGSVPPGFAAILRLIHGVQPWGMLEVFVLGSLVCFAKLARIATVVPGVGLWSFGALVLLTAGAAMTFDEDDLWRRADDIAAGRTDANTAVRANANAAGARGRGRQGS